MMAPIQYNLCGRAKHLNYFLWGEVLRFFLTKNVTKGTKELKIVGMSLFLWHYEKYFAFVPGRCTFNKKTAREFKSWSIFILTLKRKRITSFSSRGRGKETKNIAEFSEWVEVSSTDLILKHYDVRVKNRKNLKMISGAWDLQPKTETHKEFHLLLLSLNKNCSELAHNLYKFINQ